MLTQGVWKHGGIQGLGRLCHNNHWEQLGIFKNGTLLHGYTFTPFSVSLAEYDDMGHLCGVGFYLYKGGLLRVGEFVKSKLHGSGLVRGENIIYFGNFVHGKLEFGLSLSPDAIFCGSFTDNCEPDGQGVHMGDLLLTRGYWGTGVLHEIQDIIWCDNCTASNQVCLNGSTVDTLRRVVQDFRRYDTQAVVQYITDVCQVVLETLSVYPENYNTTKVYPVTSYSGVEYYSDGSAYAPASTGATYLFPPWSRYSHFVGSVVNKVPQGKGVLYTTCGTCVRGTWSKDGTVTGVVTITYKNQEVFTGSVDTDMNPTRGTITQVSGSVYTGGFAPDMEVQGYGTLLCRSGFVVSGTWLNGHLHGKNIHAYCPDRWVGKFKYINGKPQGEAFVKSVTEDSDLWEVSFGNGVVTEYHRTTDTRTEASLVSVQNELKELSSRMAVGSSRTLAVAVKVAGNCFVAKRDHVPNETLYVHVSSEDGTSTTYKSKSNKVVVRNLEPGTLYSVVVGVVTRKRSVPVHTTTIVVPESRVDIQKVNEKPAMSKLEILSYDGLSTKYTMDTFPLLAQQLATGSCRGRFGYDETTSTFVALFDS